MSIEEKLNAVVQKIYGGKGVILTQEAQEEVTKLTKLGYDKLPICIAKTQ